MAAIRTCVPLAKAWRCVTGLAGHQVNAWRLAGSRVEAQRVAVARRVAEVAVSAQTDERGRFSRHQDRPLSVDVESGIAAFLPEHFQHDTRRNGRPQPTMEQLALQREKIPAPLQQAAPVELRPHVWHYRHIPAPKRTAPITMPVIMHGTDHQISHPELLPPIRVGINPGLLTSSCAIPGQPPLSPPTPQLRARRCADLRIPGWKASSFRSLQLSG